VADAPNEPKADLKSRLGLKSRAASPPAAPIVPGAPPPEPDKPKFETPTAATIDEARRHAAEAEKAAGPAIENFQFSAPERTPLPSALPSGPRIEYVEVKGSEELPEAAKKRRTMLIIAVVIAALIAFVIGRMMGGQSARSDFNASVLLEAQAKKDFIDSKKTTFESIAVLKTQLEKTDLAVRSLDPEKGDITTLEKDFAELIDVMGKFSANKQSSIDPAEIMGGSVINGELMKELALFAFQTRAFQNNVTKAQEEAMTLLAVSRVRGPDEQKVFAIAEPDSMDVEGIGKVPFSKGTLVVQSGRAEAVQTKDAAGNPVTDFYQKVKVEGRADPLTIKTTQFVQLDMGPIWEKDGKATKKNVLARLATISSELLEQVKKIDPKPVKAAIQAVLDRGGAAAAPAAEGK